jgi:signal transduction histidine kinase
MASNDPQLKVGAHVLVQLGSELVTDVEQAILECVKNAYDADSPGCLIEIETREQNLLIEKGAAEKLKRFSEPSDSVEVTMCDANGNELLDPYAVADTKVIQRHLACTGRITIEDHGEGMSPDQLQSSWLVISQSSKRSDVGGPKAKTKGGRTPLGDKGLGRLGSMKLGDVLRVESSTSPQAPVYSAQFRWADCEVAKTVDEIPVFLEKSDNVGRFKGTKVSVLGLRDIAEWRRKDRVYDLTRSLAKLVSPFETKSTFPVKITLDGVDLSLVRITDETLKQAIAEFHFRWEDADKKVLIAEAKFKKRLFASTRTAKLKDRTNIVFGADNGAAFAEFLPTHNRMKGYPALSVAIDGQWFVEAEQRLEWKDLVPSSGGSPLDDPGAFTGSFYFFHFDNSDDSDGSATSGIGIDKDLIKSMSGISILRDGFRVRSQGDWLDISAGMTSGSTYNMRVDNTVGYFSLTGAENYKLIEKSDREGFVEDAAFRGFLAIAGACRDFANDSLENVRRSLDDYAREYKLPKTAPVAPTAEGSLQVVEDNLKSARDAKEEAVIVAAELQQEIKKLESGSEGEAPQKSAARALRIANSAIKAIEGVSDKLTLSTFPEFDLIRIRQEFEERNERAVSLLESAAVGLSARGLAHELRTHLTEIRQKTNLLEKLGKRKGADPAILPNIRAIRASCNAIVRAAGLIDPMLPRTRAMKEAIDLRELIEQYIETRRGTLDSAGIKTSITGAARTVRANRSRLIQIIDNLIRNSVYWLRRGETVLDIKRPKKIDIRLTESGFVLSDSGPGVDPRYEESLFDMFVTAKPSRDGGQGLGLFIIRQLLKIENCDITLLSDRNEDGRRYRFSVNLKSLVKV